MASISSTPRTTKLQRQRSMFIDSVTHLVPAGDEKPLKQALYTTASILLLSIVCGVAVSTYFVLQVFIKPLLWAVLCGSFLFPFKYTLNKILHNWLQQTLASNHILLVDIAILPFSLFLNLSDWIGVWFMSKWKVILGATLTLFPMYALYQLELISLFITTVLTSLTYILYVITTMLELFENHYIIIGTALVAFFATILIMQLQMPKPLIGCMWIVSLLFVVGNSGSLKLPVIILVIGLSVLGSVFGNAMEEECTKPEENIDTANESGVNELNASTSVNLLRNINEKKPSDTYFNILFVMFLLVVIWMYAWVIFLLTIPLTFWLCKKLILHAKTAELVGVLCQKLFGITKEEIKDRIYAFYTTNQTVLCPEVVQKIYSIMKKGDRKIHLSILSYLPIFTSILIILFIFFASIFFTMFMAVKVQQESVLAVQLASNVLNETVANHPEYKAWLPDNDTMQRTMDSLVNKVYVQGREWISHKLHNSASGANVSSAEKQALMLWDQVYQTWFPKQPRRLTRQSSMKVISTEKGLFNGMIDFLSASEVIGWLQENVSSLMEIVESVLMIIQSNVGLVVSAFTSIFTTILSGGTIVLNLVVSLVIFFTTLFYLLSSSKDQYKPIEVVGTVVKPILLGTPFETAMQESVSGVFGASLKMFSFYGLFTWVNHCLFGSNLVYIPTILAAVFGVIPLLTTYWVCIPSALELWLLQGSPARALGLCLFQFSPTLFVDAAIYRDISKSSGGGHPYITGLAVAGGLYSYGLEGAITGPLILCFLLVAVNLYTNATTSRELL